MISDSTKKLYRWFADMTLDMFVAVYEREGIMTATDEPTISSKQAFSYLVDALATVLTETGGKEFGREFIDDVKKRMEKAIENEEMHNPTKKVILTDA